MEIDPSQVRRLPSKLVVTIAANVPACRFDNATEALDLILQLQTEDVAQVSFPRLPNDPFPLATRLHGAISKS